MFDIEDVIWGGLAQRQENRAGEAIGPSGVDNCYRQHAYSQLGVPQSNPMSTRKADAGTLIHGGIAAQLAGVPGLETEVTVHIPGLSRPGVADIVVWAHGILIDVKTYGDRAYEARVNAGGPYSHQWDQLQLYGLGVYDTDDLEQDWELQILAVNRDNGDHTVWSQPFDLLRAQSLAAKVEGRQAAIDEAKQALADPTREVSAVVLAETFPREGDGPGRGMPCDWCPWLDQCWPAPFDLNLTPQSATVVDNPDALVTHAESFLLASAKVKEWEAVKYTAMEFLRGISGKWGQFKIAQVGSGAPTEVPDVEAMIEEYAARGEGVPMVTKAGRRPYPKVTRLK